MIYEPEEDSYLIKKHISEYSRGVVLDMGTGSGILAEEALKTADRVIAADINLKAVVKLGSKNIPGIKAIHSDLFENINEKFNLILFNPPYLPQDNVSEVMEIDSALYGGKEGYEVIEKFLEQAKKYLKSNGSILLIFTSLSKPKKIKELMRKFNYSFKLIDTKKVSFEEIFLYKLF